MKTRLLIVAILFMIGGFAHAQKVGKIETKESGFSQKKFSKAPKKVYIAEFNVNYQMAFSQTSIARGGREIGGGYRGDAKATLNVAIPDINPNEMQKLTNEVYQEYINELKQNGFEIVSADEAGKTDLFSDWERMEGGEISQAQFPGYLGTTPTGYSYYVRKVTKKGRTKNGVFAYSPKLSSQLGGAIVIKINVAVPFIENAEGGLSKSLRKGLGGVAKVVVRPNLRLAVNEAVQIGKMSSASVTTASSYMFKESLKNQGQLLVNLKKDVGIEGVFDSKKKYKASKSADVDLWGSDAGHLRIFHFSDQEVENTQPIPCEPTAYVKGVGEVVRGYVRKSLDSFLAVAK